MFGLLLNVTFALMTALPERLSTCWPFLCRLSHPKAPLGSDQEPHRQTLVHTHVQKRSKLMRGAVLRKKTTANRWMRQEGWAESRGQEQIHLIGFQEIPTSAPPEPVRKDMNAGVQHCGPDCPLPDLSWVRVRLAPTDPQAASLG